MSYCLNPNCKQPQNPVGSNYCQTCGFSLRLQNRYYSLDLIGRGGFGRTFLAIDESDADKPRCVLKQFFPAQQGTTDWEKASELFLQEVLRLEEIGQHPQIPDLLGCVEEHGYQYLIQEFIDGQNLEQELRTSGAFTEAQIWQLLNEILPVVQFLHSHQIIHRDIKPANIIRRSGHSVQLLGEGWGEFCLVDLGAAKYATISDVAKTGTVIGSAEYVAPEQARGKAVFASDIYSLGVTCLHLLTEVSPFDLFDTVNNTWAWQSYLTNPISDRLAQILDRMVENALSKRFHSAEAVMEAIAGVGQQVSAVREKQEQRRQKVLSSPYRCIHTLNGHTASIHAIAISPDGSVLASSGSDRKVRLWYLETGAEQIPLPAYPCEVRSLAFSPDGETLATGGSDGLIHLWNPASLEKQVIAAHDRAIRSLAFSPSGLILASGGIDKTIKFWSTGTGQDLAILTGHKLQVTAVAFSPNGQYFASASCDRTVCLWHISPHEAGYCIEMQHILTDHQGHVLAVAFSPDSSILATGGDDRTIKLWDVTSGQLICTLLAHSWAITALAFTPVPDQSFQLRLVSGSMDTPIYLWDFPTPTAEPQITSLVGHHDSIQAIDLTPDGNLLATASRDKTIRLWRQV